MRDLSRRKLDQLTKELASAQAAFRAEVDALAEKARAEILPYFKRHGYDYRAGNGDWIISKPSADGAPYYRPEDHVDDDDLPKNIRDLLMLEVSLNSHLGFYIHDIKRGEWQ